jgi:hypothetical protein
MAGENNDGATTSIVVSDRHNLHGIVRRFAIGRGEQACLDIAAIAAEAFSERCYY